MKKLLLIAVLLSLVHPVAFSQDINLDHFHDCWGYIFETNQEEISGALSYLSPSQSKCRNGLAVLAITKYTNRSQHQTEAEITDTLKVRSHCPENCLYITGCTDHEGIAKLYILMVDERLIEGEIFSIFKNAWSYDDNFKFINRPDQELSCENLDYGV